MCVWYVSCLFLLTWERYGHYQYIGTHQILGGGHQVPALSNACNQLSNCQIKIIMPLKPEFLASRDTPATVLVDAYAAQFPSADGSPLDQRRKRLRTIFCMHTARALGAWDLEQIKALMLAVDFSEDEIADFIQTVGTPWRTQAEIEADKQNENAGHKNAAEFQAGGEKKKQRGGRRVQSMPMLDAVREGLDDGYINNYHHPASFYNSYPAKFTLLAEEQRFISAMLHEIELVNGDAYPPEHIRKMVTDSAKIRAMNIGDPRPYAGKPKTWDVCGADSNPYPLPLALHSPCPLIPCIPFAMLLQNTSTPHGLVNVRRICTRPCERVRIDVETRSITRKDACESRHLPSPPHLNTPPPLHLPP